MEWRLQPGPDLGLRWNRRSAASHLAAASLIASRRTAAPDYFAGWTDVLQMFTGSLLYVCAALSGN